MKFGFSARHAQLLAFFVSRQSELVPVMSKVTQCADPDDDRILAAALDGQCTYLVTGDTDLLALTVGNLRILTPRVFLTDVE